MGAMKDSFTPLQYHASSTCGGDMEKLALHVNNLFQSVSSHLPPLS